MVIYAYFQQKGDELIRIPEASAEHIPLPPGPSETSWLLLFWSEEEPPSSIKLEEAEKRGLIF